MSQATLHWTSDKGFTLDLDSTQEDVTVRFMAVTVPADGTDRLREEPVGLYSMDMLFNTHVDVGHAPGQLHSATVQLDGDVLVLSADLEDAETGQQRPWSVRLPIVVPSAAPASCGFVAPEPIEDDLDWEDDGDFEMPAGMPPMPASPSNGAASTATASGGGGDAGMEALLRSLMKSGPPAAADAFEEPDDAALAALEAEENGEEDAEDDAGISSALLAALLGGGGAGDEDEDDSPGDDLEHAVNFLQLLVDREGLALEPGFTVRDLAPGAAPILMSEAPAERMATQLSNWLLDQDSVEELYIDDESLEALLDQW